MSSVPPFQEINPSPEGHGKPVTMGEFVRDVFLEQVRTVLRTCQEFHAWGILVLTFITSPSFGILHCDMCHILGTMAMSSALSSAIVFRLSAV